MSEVQYRRKLIPYAISILWRTGDGASPTDGFPLFLQQRAINALHDHFRSAPDQGILGFLLGNLYECPETGTKYAVIDLVMRLSAQIYADKTTLVVSRVWDKMQEELSKSGGRLLGWYHSHPPTGVELPSGDVETHLQYFVDPWQVALVLGADENGSAAGFFRPTRDDIRPPRVLPFFEILDPRAVTPDGKKKSSVRWKNYKPHKPPVVGAPQPAEPAAAPAPAAMPEVETPQATMAMPRMAPPPPRPPPPPPPAPPPSPLHVPSARLAPAPAPPPPAPHPPPPPASRMSGGESDARRRGRPSHPKRFSLAEAAIEPAKKGRGGLLAVLVLVLLGGGGAGYWFWLRPWLAARGQAATVAQPASGAAVTPQRPAPAPDSVGGGAATDTSAPTVAAAPTGPTARLDQLSDTLTRLVRNYQDRARLFETRQIDCAGLARGLVGVESIWISYNSERKALTIPLDGSRAARDQSLYTAVDSVESHFDRSQCDRP